jgi:hypothetical protein
MAFPQELRRPPQLAASLEFFAGASSFLKRDPHGHMLSIFQGAKMTRFLRFRTPKGMKMPEDCDIQDLYDRICTVRPQKCLE